MSNLPSAIAVDISPRSISASPDNASIPHGQ